MHGSGAERRGRPRRLGSDKEGHTIGFLLTPQRDQDAAEAFLRKAIRNQGLPEKIPIDQSGSNTAASEHYSTTPPTAIVIQHSKYLNNVVEQVTEQSNSWFGRCWASSRFGQPGVR